MKINQFEPFIGEEEYASIKSCFDKLWITEGPKSKEFLQRMEDMFGTPYIVFAPNGTLALYLALRALGIGEGDEVIVPNFTFIATANSVEMTGATPVFVDVSPDLQMDVRECEKAITSKTKAIMPAHIFGFTVDMEAICALADKYNLKVIEDAAQAIGIKRNGKPCGTFGDAGCFSFFADKTITMGEGGLVIVKDKDVYDNLLYLRNQGRKNRGSFLHPEIGYNFRITDMQAAVGLTQLNKLPTIIDKKAQIFEWYKSGLRGIENVEVYEPDLNTNPYIPFRVVIKTKNKSEGLMCHLSSAGIETRGFFVPLHQQPCYDSTSSDAQFPNSVFAFEHGVCLPSFVAITEEQVLEVCQSIKRYYNV
tara:strand:+ start:5190 stop:6281 length:1092 start_codon:yes stop_codon:yes gene_type:complete